MFGNSEETFQNENTSRVGCATNYFLPLSSLGTKIGGRSYSRISMVQNKWGRMVYKERSLLNVLNNIEVQCKKYDINNNWLTRTSRGLIY